MDSRATFGTSRSVDSGCRTVRAFCSACCCANLSVAPLSSKRVINMLFCYVYKNQSACLLDPSGGWDGTNERILLPSFVFICYEGTKLPAGTQPNVVRINALCSNENPLWEHIEYTEVAALPHTATNRFKITDEGGWRLRKTPARVRRLLPVVPSGGARGVYENQIDADRAGGKRHKVPS